MSKPYFLSSVVLTGVGARPVYVTSRAGVTPKSVSDEHFTYVHIGGGPC